VANIAGISGQLHRNTHWDQAQKESAGLSVPMHDILAGIIAHEIGHVFLGPNSHSLSGIMTAKWKHRDLTAISQGGHDFTPRQRELIRAEAKRRQAQQAASRLPDQK
jgi:hypothetical protein